MTLQKQLTKIKENWLLILIILVLFIIFSGLSSNLLTGVIPALEKSLASDSLAYRGGIYSSI